MADHGRPRVEGAMGLGIQTQRSPDDEPWRANSNGDLTARSASPTKSDASATERTAFEPYFNPFNLRRAESVYSLSRASFSNQLSQLASLQLPQASSLAAGISAIPTSTAAARALTDAAEQIRKWIDKALQVLRDLDAEDDVEWAAAGGREGLGEVDNAVRRFEGLIKVYVGAIEGLQCRADVGAVPSDELRSVVTEMDKTIEEWDRVRAALDNVKKQVELAMEWEELLNVVLADIGVEVEDLARLVFEMEEKRHRSQADDAADAAKGLDIVELETIVEEAPAAGTRRGGGSNVSDLPALNVASSPLQSPVATMARDDSTLLGLFARMQPLRASLDFLPMTLSSFHSRAEPVFRSACQELQETRDGLEADFARLEKDAERLRRELGEDRWVLVFRNAGRQAQKMCESIGRSMAKVREAVDAPAPANGSASLAKRVESYEAKKTHYGPSIERLLVIIGRGVKDRLTVNGEILRLRSATEAQWKALEQDMRALDGSLEALHPNKTQQQLRDSISTIMSLDRSAGGSTVNTPGSSPASSVVMTGPHGSKDPITPVDLGRTLRPRAGSRASSLPRPSLDRRHVSMPPAPPSTTAGPQATRKPATLRQPSTPLTASRLGSPSPATNRASATPTPGNYGSRARPSLSATEGKPRWNSSVSVRDTVIGHNFKPLTLTTPSPHRKAPVSCSSSSSLDKVQHPSPLGRDRSHSPATATATASPTRQSLSFRESRQSSLSPARPSVGAAMEPPRPRLKTAASSSRLQESRTARKRADARESTVAEEGAAGQRGTPARPKVTRPASAMASGRRTSLLPQPKSSLRNSVGGRESLGGAGAGPYLSAPAQRGGASGRSSPAVGGQHGREHRPVWR
ncbi:MAG: hypothetical protein M1832_002368 [Thelocarpon impressellum]|nr:MAG: hypothetical protein M1832_002368 [Thelocarpon impressellum]